MKEAFNANNPYKIIQDIRGRSMCVKAIAWALEVQGVKPTHKAILIILANNHNSSTRLCFPKQSTIAQQACVSVQTLRRHMQQLEQMHLIKRYITKTKGNTITYYTLKMNRDEPIESWEDGELLAPETVKFEEMTAILSDPTNFGVGAKATLQNEGATLQRCNTDPTLLEGPNEPLINRKKEPARDVRDNADGAPDTRKGKEKTYSVLWNGELIDTGMLQVAFFSLEADDRTSLLDQKFKDLRNGI